jgi:hypothetical protein
VLSGYSRKDDRMSVEAYVHSASHPEAVRGTTESAAAHARSPNGVVGIAAKGWPSAGAAADRERALDALESGKVVCLADHTFEFAPSERRFLDPACSDGKAKNISFDPRTGAIGGAALSGGDCDALRRLLLRFGSEVRALVSGLFPRYAPHLELGRASLRPVAIDGRRMSAHKDDRRLHVDAFPSHPVQGRRILRVFVNVDPRGEARVWQVGEAFADYARRFLPRRAWAMPGTARLLEDLGITKGRRTPYDRLMLRLHDRAKADAVYQGAAPREEIRFPAGSSWIVFTDVVPHAAVAGQGALEQTFYLPIGAMRDPDLAPLHVLERLTQRRLAPGR